MNALRLRPLLQRISTRSITTPSPAPSRPLSPLLQALNKRTPSASQPSSSPQSRPNPRKPIPKFTYTRAFQDQFTLSSSSAASQQAPLPTPDNIWSSLPPLLFTDPLLINSSRTFQVKGGDVGGAYKRLNRTLMENNVRKELKKGEYFEKGSDRRVRLASERHRRRFKVAVGRAVSLGTRMKDL